MSASDKKTGNAGGVPPSKTLPCVEWEALLVDALDGTLPATESAAFQAHRDSCIACSVLLEETKRGSEWLHFLGSEPEVPAGLVGKILAQTSGAAAPLPSLIPGAMAVPIPVAGGWSGSWLPMVERRAAQSRWIMTAAMAFFSIAFTLNMTGVKLSGFRLSDLTPATIASSLTHEFYMADRGVMRYYDSLRFVYEVESRVREISRDASVRTAPAQHQNPADGTQSGGQDKQSPEKHTGGSAQKAVPEPAQEPEHRAEPTVASFERRQHSEVRSIGKNQNGKTNCMRAERSLA